MSLDIFWKNIGWNLDQVNIQQGHASSVKGRARSGYYKAAVLFAGSVAEALAYKLLELKIKNLRTEELPLEDWEYLKAHHLPAGFGPADARLAICIRRQPRFKLENDTDFIKINRICNKLGLISNVLFRRLEHTRTLRNKVHIQGLETSDSRWTKKKLEKISSTIVPLVDMVEKAEKM